METIAYRAGDAASFGDAPHGDRVVAVCDPPNYLLTRDYADGDPLPLGLTPGNWSYEATRNLIRDLVDRGDAMVYTDEAWWHKENYSPDTRELNGSSTFSREQDILLDIINTLDHFDVAGRVAGRQETLGIQHGHQRDDAAAARGENNRNADPDLSADPGGIGGDRRSVRRVAGIAEDEGRVFRGTGTRRGRESRIALARELTGSGPRFSVRVGDSLADRAKYDLVVRALARRNRPPANVLTPDATPQDAARYFSDNLLGRTLTTPNGETLTLDARHFYRLTCEGRGKGFVEGFRTGMEAFDAILGGEVKAGRIRGYRPDRARMMPLFADVVEHPDVILQQGNVSQFIKRYEAEDGRAMTAVFRMFEDGRKILSFHGFGARYGELKQYHIAYLSDAVETGTSPATSVVQEATPPTDARIIPQTAPGAQGGADDRRSVRRRPESHVPTEVLLESFVAQRILAGRKVDAEDVEKLVRNARLTDTVTAAQLVGFIAHKRRQVWYNSPHGIREYHRAGNSRPAEDENEDVLFVSAEDRMRTEYKRMPRVPRVSGCAAGDEQGGRQADGDERADARQHD